MKLDTAIAEVLTLSGCKTDIAPAIASVFRKAGAPENVPDRVINKVLKAGEALKALGVE